MRRDPIATLGLALVGVATLVASFSALAELARYAGWSEWSSWLLPIAIDALAMVAGRYWLLPTVRDEARAYARNVTLVAVVLSIAGNGTAHLVATGHLVPGLAMVVLVGAVPPAALAAVMHLAVLAAEPKPVPASVAAPHANAQAVLADVEPSTTKPPAKPKKAPLKAKVSTAPSTGTELLAQAREADKRNRDRSGEPISRNKLRMELGIGQVRATELIDLLKEEVAS